MIVGEKGGIGMKLRKRIILALSVILLSSGIIITALWYSASSKLSDTYLDDISQSTMLDAYHAFEYLLTDTSYMVTLIAANEPNIIEPAENLNAKNLMDHGQWNQNYLDNRRVIMDYIRSLNGYKYYISGITVAISPECVFSTSYIIQNKKELYEEILKLDQNTMRTSMVMMDPVHLEGLKYTLSSDYVVPAVRAILNENGRIVGYVVLYFDYGVIDQMFSANLPEGSIFRVINRNGSEIFSNQEATKYTTQYAEKYVWNTFEATDVGWEFEMGIPADFYLSGIRDTVLLSGAVMIIILLLAGLAFAFYISLITTEITNLRNCMARISDGDLNAFYEVKRHDEIGEMGETFNSMTVEIRELMQRVAEEEKQKRRSELAFLQAQINPHFISNVLNNVVWMAKIQHADNIVPLVNSLNSMLQSAMHQEKDLIRFRDELEYVNNYLALMEYIGNYDFYVEREISADTLDLYIPRFILQPVVENSIYHGMPEDLSKRGCIRIGACREEDRLYITVEDNGNGMSPEEISKILAVKDRRSFNGIGVENVNSRIQLFFGTEYGLRYESKKGEYTRCIFQLPAIEEDESWKK